MKFLLTVWLICFSSFSFAQIKLAGTWEGTLKAGISLRVVFHFNDNARGGIAATMDSPDQGVNGITTDTAYRIADSVFVVKAQMQMQFAGKLLNDSTINGTFTQGISFPLLLKKVEKVTVINKPQTPVPPFPYVTEDVSYTNTAKSITFGATVTYPSIPPGVNYIKAPVYPVIILISGSGPQNRDSEILNHKSFAVMADHFTRLGYMVFRYDERGVGKSTGEFSGATSEDFTDDVITAYDFIRKHVHADSMNISLVGHSEGGLIAPRVANRRMVRSIVLLAGPGIPVIDLMTEQNTAVLRSSGYKEATVSSYSYLYRNIAKALVSGTDTLKAKEKAGKVMKKWIKATEPEIIESLQLNSENNRRMYIQTMGESFFSPWYRYFMNYDPKTELRKLKGVHVLALNGDKDIQVISRSNLQGMRKQLSKSKAASYKVEEIKGVNHLFQTCNKCTLTEYGELEETFSPEVLKLIGDWFRQTSL